MTDIMLWADLMLVMKFDHELHTGKVREEEIFFRNSIQKKKLEGQQSSFKNLFFTQLVWPDSFNVIRVDSARWALYDAEVRQKLLRAYGGDRSKNGANSVSSTDQSIRAIRHLFCLTTTFVAEKFNLASHQETN